MLRPSSARINRKIFRSRWQSTGSDNYGLPSADLICNFALQHHCMPIVENQPLAPQPGLASRDTAGLIVRVLTGLSMILYNSWLMVQQGWGYLWGEGDWVLLDVVTELGFPFPVASAIAIASIYFFGSIFLMVGVFGRVPSVVMLVATEIGFYFALRAGEIAYVELGLLYGTLYLVHLVLGSGRISLDHLLARGGKRRTRRRKVV